MRGLGWIVWVLVALALVCRLGAVLATDDHVPRQDAADYLRHAVSIAAGDGYPESSLVRDGGPTALRPPLYPYAMGGVFAVTGNRYNVFRAGQALLGVLAAALLGLLAAELFGRRVGIFALGIAAVYPPLVLLSTVLLSETLFVTLELAVLLAALRGGRSERPLLWGLTAGLLAGLAILTRQNGVVLLLPAALALWGARRGGPARRGLPPVLALLATTAVVVTPWSIRNTAELDRFVPVATQTGVLLAGIYNDSARDDPDFPGAWRPPNGIPEYRDLFERPGLTEGELDGELRSRATDYAKDHPGYVAEAAGLNAARMLQLTPRFERFAAADLNISEGAARVGRFSFYALALLALLGAFTSRAREAPWWIWIAPVLMFASGALLAGLIRYRLPADPFLILLAALAVAQRSGSPSMRATSPATSRWRR